MDKPQEECAVFAAALTKGDVARTLFLGMYALQHRGQEGAGMVTLENQRHWHVHKDHGLVRDVFHTEETIKQLKGNIGVGHCRYATSGSQQIANLQPFFLETFFGSIAIAHNGQLAQAKRLREELMRTGIGLFSESDSEVIAQFMAQPALDRTEDLHKPFWEERIARFLGIAEGAYSVVLLTQDAMFAFRDPLGIRPLCIGKIDDSENSGFVVSSESCALQTIGAQFIKEVGAGEIVRITPEGIESFRPVPQKDRLAACVFEFVYFSRPDSFLWNASVHEVRENMGKRLAIEHPVHDAHVVAGVPDSSIPMAIGYALASGIPYRQGLIKNRYIARTFIHPGDAARQKMVSLKYNILDSTVRGKIVVLVDDSLVRGSTIKNLASMFRSAGAVQIHIRIASPPVRHPCFMGVDMKTPKELIANRFESPEALAKFLDVDSLAYLSSEGLYAAVRTAGASSGLCSACFTGNYPLDIEDTVSSSKVCC